MTGIAQKPSYVGAYYDYDTDAVMVWVRDEAGRRVVPHHAPWYFYVPAEDGKYTSIFGDKLKRLDFDTKAEFQAAGKAYAHKFESDIPPLFKVLMNEYYDLPAPPVHHAFVDIEVDYKSSIGFSSPENPYAPINAVTIYQSWTGAYLTFAVPPRGWSDSDFMKKIEALWAEHKLGFKPNITLCKTEEELLRHLVAEIQDSDIISGWNSEFFDLPYIMKRLERVSPKLVNKMSFTGCKPPRETKVERYGTPTIVYTLNGRTHLDYLDLYKKFTFEGRTSYSLANITAEELDIQKLHYEGTLEELYNNDFAHFVAYNARDVESLVKLDEKFKFIAMVNLMAHENTSLFQNILGTVRYVETGITNRVHHVHKKIVADKRIMTDGEKVEGAIVLSPNVGLHDWLGSIDIKSLYPNTIVSLNISPETFIGQFSCGEADWRGIIDMDEHLHTLVFDDGENLTMSGEEWWGTLLDNKWAISGYGTVFSQADGLGVVPDTIKFWYDERVRLQGEKKRYMALTKNETDQLKKAEYQILVERYDLLQLTRKTTCNSAYGALLSPHFRFGRKEMGASVTGSGRQITTFMLQQTGELISGIPTKITKSAVIEKDGSVAHIYRSDNDVLLLSDTDSVAGESIVRSNLGTMPIAELFERGERINKAEREFSILPGLTSLTSDGHNIVEREVLAIYRHKVSKPRWKITLNDGRSVVVTGDHSIMVMRNGNLIEVKPESINRDTDTCVAIGDSH